MFGDQGVGRGQGGKVVGACIDAEVAEGGDDGGWFLFPLFFLVVGGRVVGGCNLLLTRAIRRGG